MSIKIRKAKIRSELSTESLTLMNVQRSERWICVGSWRHDKRNVRSRQSSGSKRFELFLFSGFCNFCPCQLMKGLIICLLPTTHYHRHSKKDNSIYFYDRDRGFWGLDEICYLSCIWLTVSGILKNIIKTNKTKTNTQNKTVL